jgi:hypothetical protein
MEQQAATRRENAGELAVEGAFVGNVHLHVLGPNNVKRTIGER